MLQAFIISKQRQRIAWMMLLILVSEFTLPTVSYALSSGPVQPEISSFEPVGTTDMVDLFTGDFVYNIPLLDVEGYPVNIAYHGGVTMEQEASWVGLGWNISPGSVNRAVRGLPDEFAGDTIEKEMHIKPEINKKFGMEAGMEIASIGKPVLNLGLGLGGYVTISNYRGVGVDFTTSAGLNTSFKFISAGVNVGASIGSQSGAAIDYNASVGVGISRSVSDDMNATGSFNLNAGGVYSPRSGHRNNVGIGVNASLRQSGQRQSVASMSTGTSVPIGLQNYSAAITNPCYMNTISGQLRFGGEIFSVYPSVKVNGSYSKIEYAENGSRKGFGYFNLDKSGQDDLTDFSREKDGNFNPTMHFLPQSHLTYDIYSVSGQGTGGSFRPFRNDIGSIYDPYTKSPETGAESLSIEAGIGNLFEAGTEYTHNRTNVESGPWPKYVRPFRKDSTGYNEPVYFKEAGELTENNETYLDAYGRENVLTPDSLANIPLLKPNAGTRIVRANHIFTHSGADADTAALVDGKTLVSYTDANGFANYPTVGKTTISRVDTDPAKKLKRHPHHVTEIIQTQKDGRRYVYGLPVLNNVQREVTFAADINNNLDRDKFLVGYKKGIDDSKQNRNGLDHFYSATVTPTYVAAHLLTGVLSKDYIDVTGNGITDDDLGTYTKFNYSRKSSDYRWRSPIEESKAQYIPGYISDKRDDKASFLIGSREQWLLHTIETRNQVAEFYVSGRADAHGVLDTILKNGPVYKDALYSKQGLPEENRSFKLDSIVLFNKHDRFMNGAQAQPIKTILFTYDYTLCPGVPNSSNSQGKLTLKRIQMRYGTSNLNLSAAYSFRYGSPENNPAYNIAEKDRWGFYKENDPTCNNYEFPFVKQKPETDDYAKAWSLSEITLPSGGVIKVEYEADDYGYVQDQLAMEMFMIKGFGNSQAYRPNANQLYYNITQQNQYLYFERRKDAENPQLSFAENYLKGTKILYYNVPVELADSKYEPVKGYAVVEGIGMCSNDSDYAYVLLKGTSLKGTPNAVNPITYTALNLGRYSLPHILFPGSDPDATDMANIAAGLKNAIAEMWGIHQNPLKNMINQGKAQDVNLKKAFVRLTSPGLKKKGGGQRVKSLRFYDRWEAMAGGKEAEYGKVYDYSMEREDRKGRISSGVASYEPMIGGDEIPHRQPAGYEVQRGSSFPPNDPVELYLEYPLGESFFPSPVVGYRKVTSRSIHADKARSAQSEDVNNFYTAKDFPIKISNSPINTPELEKTVDRTNIKFTQATTQGFSIVLNDMHGKPRATEHWVLKGAGSGGAISRELINSQEYEYMTRNGELRNDSIPTFNYKPGDGQLRVMNRKMGIESDLTIDSRSKKEVAKMQQVSVSVNGFFVAFVPIVIAIPIPFELGNDLSFKCATVTKVTQQYGILSKVTSNNEGAITTVRNEVFDSQTGNALVTSVNNQFRDRVYSVSYPAHWGYKELGPSYENQDANGVFHNPMILDSLGTYFQRTFVNYNTSYSSHYKLPSNMPVARVMVNEEMGKFKLGDELLLQAQRQGPFSTPVKAWVMGYVSDTNNCFLIMATREPYKQGFAPILNNNVGIHYRVIRSGNKNRLGETIQSYTTTDSTNIFPYLKDQLNNVISFGAQTYKHNLNQVFAANTVSDSLNPFITGKTGNYNLESQIINLKKREYAGAATRNAGLFSSAAYWKTEKDNYAGYCLDSFDIEGNQSDTIIHVPAYDPPHIPDILSSMQFRYLGGDSIEILCTRYPNLYDQNAAMTFSGWGIAANNPNGNGYIFYPPSWPSLIGFYNYTATQTAPGRYVIHDNFLATGKYNLLHENEFEYNAAGYAAKFGVIYNPVTNIFTIRRHDYVLNGIPGPATYNNIYEYDPISLQFTGQHIPEHYDTVRRGVFTITPFRIRKKITLAKVGHYTGTDFEKWVKTQDVTKYNWFGAELENYERGIGYNAAIYGYNQQLPVCVVKNARHDEVLYEGFEDVDLLHARADRNESYMPLFYSPFEPLFANRTWGSSYWLRDSTASLSGTTVTRSVREAHTGYHALHIGSNDVVIPLNGNAPGMASGYSFKMQKDRKYVASIWVKPDVSGTQPTIQLKADTLSPGGVAIIQLLEPKSNIIDGWQQYEAVFMANGGTNFQHFELLLGRNCHYDDLRIYPFESNSKGFVYHPVTRKLMASLDENNFATFYEYDAEGNLVRTKKETDKGILTVSESRSSHRKN
jgi:hypothetical protein